MTHDAEERVRAYLDARDAALAHLPRIGPGVITGWPRTDDDADGEFELTATDLRAVLQALADTRQQLDEADRRIAELETEQGHADTRLRVEHYRLQARNSEARALANGWRTYALQQRGEDGEWIAMHKAFGAILAALDGDASTSDAGESRDETRPA